MATTNQSVLAVLNWLKSKAESSSVLSMYPIGSVYMTANAAFNPNSEWGVWVKIENRFLLGSGTKAVGAQGGEESVTLTTNQMPSHAHSPGNMNINGEWSTTGFARDEMYVAGAVSFNYTARKSSDGTNKVAGVLTLNANCNWTGSTSSMGGDQAHNNMPPYEVINIWRRTA